VQASVRACFDWPTSSFWMTIGWGSSFGSISPAQPVRAAIEAAMADAKRRFVLMTTNELQWSCRVDGLGNAEIRAPTDARARARPARAQWLKTYPGVAVRERIEHCARARRRRNIARPPRPDAPTALGAATGAVAVALQAQRMILRRRGWILPEPESLLVGMEILLDSRGQTLLLADPELRIGEVTM